MEYCIAAASSPLAPPNCSSSMLPKAGSGVPTRTVYISFLTWWYMGALWVMVVRRPGRMQTTYRPPGPEPCSRHARPLHRAGVSAGGLPSGHGASLHLPVAIMSIARRTGDLLTSTLGEVLLGQRLVDGEGRPAPLGRGHDGQLHVPRRVTRQVGAGDRGLPV